MLAGVKIVFDVVVYRLRKLEMANLAAAVSIAMVLHLGWLEVAYRTLFAFVLNILVYLNNDYLDIGTDLRSTDKDAKKARFLSEHLRAALVAQWVLVGLLAAAALVRDRGLLVALVAGGGSCVWYSAKLKQRPYLDILAMMVWGAAMPLCGAPLDSALGFCLALQLGLFSGVFESVQVLRDADQDALEGVRTTAVVLGKARTLALARILMVASSAYALLILHPIAAAVSAAALLLPFAPDRVERYWTRVKLTYGVAWLVLCGYVYLYGHSSGVLWSIGKAAGPG
jgi:4-hydroxybenzoate polyprenyltransferase